MAFPEPRHDPIPPADQELIRRRQRSRSIATALLLGGLVILFFAISIAKMVH